MSAGLGHTAWPRGCSWGPKQKLEVPGGPSRSELGLALGKGSTGVLCVVLSPLEEQCPQSDETKVARGRVNPAFAD